MKSKSRVQSQINRTNQEKHGYCEFEIIWCMDEIHRQPNSQNTPCPKLGKINH